MSSNGKTYGIDISFEELKLPIYHDVLVLAKNTSQGKHGLHKSLDLLAPGIFQIMDGNLDNERIAAVYINRSLLLKIPPEQIIKLLKLHVFDHVAEGELIQVRVNVRISMNNLSC